MSTEHNLAREAERHAATLDPSHRSVLFEGTWTTVAQARDRIERLGRGLADYGVGAGDRVVIVMANTPDVAVLYHALWRCGAVATPAMFLLPPAEIRHIVLDSDATIVVTGPEFVGSVTTAVDGLDVPVVLARDDVLQSIPAGVDATLDDLASGPSGTIVPRSDHDLAALLYTGGTTGRSKGVMLTHDNLWHAGRMGHETTAEHDLHRTLVPLPLAHVFGVFVTANGLFGAPEDVSVLQRWFEPVTALELLQRERIDQVTLVPTMLRMLLDLDLASRDLSSLRRVVVGSAPLPVPHLEAFQAAVPTAQVCEGYGLTETCAAATAVRLGAPAPGTVGPPLPDVEVQVVDDALAPVPAGSPGEVLVRSPAVSPGYWKDPDATAVTFVDGWCRTGDVGVLDDDGNLRIVDRIKDLIIRGGFNIHPREVEERLQEHPDIAAAGVVGRPDDTYGEEVVAFVAPSDGAVLDPDEIRTWAKEHVGAKAYPREVQVVPALPLTPVLKLDRKQLRERL